MFLASPIFRISRFPDFFGLTSQISRINLEIYKTGNLGLKNLEVWKSGNLVQNNLEIRKSANLTIWKLNLLCMRFGFQDFQIFYFHIPDFQSFWTSFPDFQNDSGNLQIRKFRFKNLEMWKVSLKQSRNMEICESADLGIRISFVCSC